MRVPCMRAEHSVYLKIDAVRERAADRKAPRGRAWNAQLNIRARFRSSQKGHKTRSVFERSNIVSAAAGPP